MRDRVFIKLLASFLLVIAVATGILDFAIRRAWEQSLRRELSESLTEKTQLFAQRFENDSKYAPAQLAAQVAATTKARATIADNRGKVLADSEADPAKMENHATRPQFMTALSRV